MRSEAFAVTLPVGRLALLLALLLLPGAAASLLLPRLLAHPPSPAGLLLWRAALALPAILLPTLVALTRLQRHQSRAAAGLGAGRLDRLRWVWLPQLGPGIAASLLLAILFALGGHLARSPLH
jgi:ABC-type spermidine/putrescine transport system permease subunit I